MKNRLEVARELLRNDGVIFVQCDDSEQAYLKVLMDEIFGRKNFITTITVATDARTRNYEALSKTHKFVLVYSITELKELYQIIKNNKKFAYEDNEGGFDLYELRNRNADFNINNRPNLFYSFYLNPNNKDENELYEVSLTKHKGWIEVLPQKSGKIQTVWRQSKETVFPKLNKIIFGKDAKNGYQIVKKYRETNSSTSSIWIDNLMLSDRGTLENKSLFDNKKVFAFPKPEAFIERIIEIATMNPI
jgi:adenine-specific DNA-methyltransferase